MLSSKAATKIVLDNLPNGKIQANVVYEDLYIFQVFTDLPGEEEFDPFYSVDRKTGEFSDFSIITDGDTDEILSLFREAKGL